MRKNILQITDLIDDNTMEIEILGEKWTVEIRDEAEDSYLSKVNGYCDYTTKTIVVANLKPVTGSYGDLGTYIKQIIRHEVIHAFLDESGLMHNSDWARNEEVVDYFAIQFPKILKVFQKLKVI